ncbi:helix-turn-helix domain-containing protein [Corynebacterium vitaeruminis]|uniref:helix-turn-helix domain-containing protein n=1 Tax=Corynebacterium TaxID=1716 RepID=UPI0012DEA7D6
MGETKSCEGEEKWYSPPVVAGLLPGNPTPETVRNWIRSGKVPGARRSPGNRWQIPQSGLDHLMESFELPKEREVNSD